MFYDGSGVRMLASYVDGGLQRPQFSDGESPKMCFANGKYYFLSGTDLWWLDAASSTFGTDTMGPIGPAGIQGVQLGDGQAHVLAQRMWDTTTSALQQFTVLHTGEQFTNFAGAGSYPTSYYAPIDLIFAPIVPEPDQEVTVQEVWLDASWNANATPADAPMLYWSDDGMQSWNLAGPAPQGNMKLGFRGAKGGPMYLRLQANYAQDFHLYGAKVLLDVSQTRGDAT
jgi:hypothetical protein